jgi:UDP-N-acetylmuramate--alanine ligase
LLVRDGGIRGVVICLAGAEFCRIEARGNQLHCGAGARLKSVAVEAKRQGLTGLEFLEGIPGSVGGALRMNAGAMGSEMFQTVERVRFMDRGGRVHERLRPEIDVQYRRCELFEKHIALAAVLNGSPASRGTIEQRMGAFSRKRWASQPAAPSAGCIFRNPEAGPAGKLVEELGLKGLRVGGAAISERHGNFIVNDGNATARDVLDLISLVQSRARAERGVELQTEVQIIGEDAKSERGVEPTCA